MVHSTKVFPLNSTPELTPVFFKNSEILKSGPGIVIGQSSARLEAAGQKQKLGRKFGNMFHFLLGLNAIPSGNLQFGHLESSGLCACAGDPSLAQPR